jgi:hypothetical protein
MPLKPISCFMLKPTVTALLAPRCIPTRARMMTLRAGELYV